MKAGLQEIEIFYNGKFIQKADYTQLGFFSGNKQQKPDRQWSFLRALSVLAGIDITKATALTMMGMVAKDYGRSITRPALHKVKETLAKRLRAM